ncbi:MAG: hypothetical protein JWM76_3642 [Pseudonocardiales bacterium]|nr:hypothetical protein [Pseudonocardiales bacterium]
MAWPPAGDAHTSWWTDASDQLFRSAARLDARLALIEGEPDAAIRDELVATLGPRVEQVIADAAAMRSAAYALTIELEQPGTQARRSDLRDRIDGLLLALRELARP